MMTYRLLEFLRMAELVNLKQNITNTKPRVAAQLQSIPAKAVNTNAHTKLSHRDSQF